MKFKTLFMSDEEKHSHLFDFQLLAFFYISKQFLAPGVWVLSVFKLMWCKHGASRVRELALRLAPPPGLRSSNFFLKMILSTSLKQCHQAKSSIFLGNWSKTPNSDQNWIYTSLTLQTARFVPLKSFFLNSRCFGMYLRHGQWRRSRDRTFI